MGVDAAAGNEHPGRGGAIRRGPTHHFLFRAGDGAGGIDEAELAVDHGAESGQNRSSSIQFRVFVFNTRHRRYETAFSEKGLKGFYPVEVSSDESGGPVTQFSFIVQDDKGNFFRKRYSFSAHSARLVSREPFHLNDGKEPPKEPPSIALVQAAEQRSWYERTKDAVGKQWQRWFN